MGVEFDRKKPECCTGLQHSGFLLPKWDSFSTSVLACAREAFSKYPVCARLAHRFDAHPRRPCQDPSSGVDRSVHHSRVHRTVCLPETRCSSPPNECHPPECHPHSGCNTRCSARTLTRMTVTAATAADLALAEIHEHLAAIEKLSHEPFNDARVSIHRMQVLECLDTIAEAIA